MRKKIIGALLLVFCMFLVGLNVAEAAYNPNTWYSLSRLDDASGGKAQLTSNGIMFRGADWSSKKFRFFDLNNQNEFIINYSATNYRRLSNGGFTNSPYIVSESWKDDVYDIWQISGNSLIYINGISSKLFQGSAYTHPYFAYITKSNDNYYIKLRKIGGGNYDLDSIHEDYGDLYGPSVHSNGSVIYLKALDSGNDDLIFKNIFNGKTRILESGSYSRNSFGFYQSSNPNYMVYSTGSSIKIISAVDGTVFKTINVSGVNSCSLTTSKLFYTISSGYVYAYDLNSGVTRNIGYKPNYTISFAVHDLVSLRYVYYYDDYDYPYSYTYDLLYYDMPNKPVINTTGGTATSISLSWSTADSGQGTWELYDGNTLIYSGTNTSFTHNVTNGSTHNYKVRYYQFGCYSKFSDVKTATTVPATPSTPTGTVGGVSWSNNPNNPGRSYVTLNWAPVTGATGYKVYMFDGYQYRMVQDVGNKTTWDSRTARIFPAESVLDSKTDNTVTTNLFVTPTTGYDLPDRPTKLYKKTAGTAYDSSTNYWFRVTAYNATGESPQSDAYMPTLPDRTDTEAPTGSIVINEGAYNTANREVTLDISGSDTESGIAQMQFSSDNISWTSWETFKTTKQYQIGTNGEQRVYMKLKDNAGNVSNIISQSIFFINDTQPPELEVKINGGAKQTESNLVKFEITAQDNLTTPENLKMRVSMDGSNWYIYDSDSKTWFGSTGWGEYTAFSENFNIGTAGGPKYFYIQVKDPSGNVSNATATIFYITGSVAPGLTTPEPVSTSSWGVNLNGQYINIDGKTMMVRQENSVSLNLTGINKATGLSISFDGLNWSEPETIPSGATSFTKEITFDSQGKKAVHIKLKNEYGVESQTLVRYYLVDYTAPDIEARTASGATLTSGSSINLLIKAKDNISTRLAYRINGSAWSVLPTNGIVSSGSLGNGRNQLKIEVIDEAGNVSQDVVNVWKN